MPTYRDDKEISSCHLTGHSKVGCRWVRGRHAVPNNLFLVSLPLSVSAPSLADACPGSTPHPETVMSRGGREFSFCTFSWCGDISRSIPSFPNPHQTPLYISWAKISSCVPRSAKHWSGEQHYGCGLLSHFSYLDVRSASPEAQDGAEERRYLLETQILSGRK